MKMIRLRTAERLGLAALAATVVIGYCASARGVAATPPTYAVAGKLEFLRPTDIDPAKLLPLPPPDGSDVQASDMAYLKQVISTRTAARFAQAQWDNDHEDPIFIERAVGPNFKLRDHPKTAALLDAAVNEVHVATSLAKRHFHRKFAVVLDPALIKYNCDPAAVRKEDARPGGRVRASYPSGHASLGYTVGIILADLIPEESQAIMSRAADYAFSREVCGEHYRDDVEASHALGTAVGVMLLHNADFRNRLAAARRELRSAHITR